MTSYTLHHISSLDIPQLQPYRTLRRVHEHLQKRIFVAEAEKVVRRFLQSDWNVVSLLLTKEWFEMLIPTVEESRLAGVDIFVGEKKLLESIVGFTLHQGIMAVGNVPADRSLKEIMDILPSPHFLVALDGLVHAENVGVVVRNCAGFGVDGIISGKNSASPYLRRAIRNSMGGIFKLPVVHANELAGSLTSLKDQYSTRIIIADAHAERTMEEMDLTGNICIVFGNEDEGVTHEVNAVATDRVRIPMSKSTDSLNVASASAVVLYEARNQRNS